MCLKDGSKAIYKGESGRNAYTRGLEHQADLKNKDEESPLWKHCSLQHAGEIVEFTMKALRGFNSSLERHVNEGVRVTSSTADIILNSKNEFHQAPIVRVVLSTGLHGDQGESQDAVIPPRGRQGPGRGQSRGGSITAGRGRRQRG